MHRNTYLNGPAVLSANYAMKGEPLIRFAGQLSGVEGYMESTASGLVAAIGLARALRGQPEPDFTGRTIVGALAKHVCTPNANFQPMNANFGIMRLDAPVRRNERKEAYAPQSLNLIREMVANHEL